MKIVWIRMYDDGATNDIGYCKLWCNCGKPCHAVIYEKRWQITGVHGVRAIVGIVVRAGIGKRILRSSDAACTFMNMKTKNTLATGNSLHWDSLDGNGNQGPLS